MEKFSEFCYKRPNYDEVKKQMRARIEELKIADAKLTVTLAEELNLLNSEINSQQIISNIRHSIDITDTFYNEENDYWNEYAPLYEELITDYYRGILASPHQEVLRTTFPATFFLIAENQLKTFSPAIIELSQTENNLISRYEKILATAEVEFNNEKMPLPKLGPFYQSPDRHVRQAADQVRSHFFASKEIELDEIYDSLVKVRTSMAKELGYPDYVAMGYDMMNRFDYDRNMVESYRKEILSQVVPLTQKLYKRQAERLGLETLYHYDLPIEFSEGNAIPKGTAEEILDKGVTMYQELSPETGEFMSQMMDRQLLDVLSKPGKQSGGYCDFIASYQAPFIFANFNGTSGDIDVLTHEAGHAFQVYQSRWIKEPECVFPTYESCEIHSMSMEFFTWPWMHLFFEEQTEKYYYSHLSDAVEFLPYGVLVDHFQHEVYEHPEMTPQERKTTWRRLERMYCPERDYSHDNFLEKGTYWYRQGHIFASPFYYIDYTLAQVCAFQFWQKAYIEKDPCAWNDYMSICKVGGTKTFLEIINLAKLNSPFEEGSLRKVMETIDGYLSNIKDEVL